MNTLVFAVVGDPAPKGSKVARGKAKDGHTILVESSAKLPAWSAAVTAAAQAAIDLSPDWHQPTVVGAVLVFRFRRPRKHYRTGRHSHLLKPDAPQWHTTTPDCDKLQRATFDLLKPVGVIKDDSQIAKIQAEKVYVGDGDWTGAEVTLYSLDTPVLL